MITWVVFLAVGILIGIGVGLYVSRLDDAAKRTQNSLNKQLQDKEIEMAAYKKQVNSHFVTTANLVNNMTESYRAVHEHLSTGANNLCDDAANVSSLPFEDKKMITGEPVQTSNTETNVPESSFEQAKSDSVETSETETSTEDEQLSAPVTESSLVASDTSIADTHEHVEAKPETEALPQAQTTSPEPSEKLEMSDSDETTETDTSTESTETNVEPDKNAAEPVVSDIEQSRIDASRMVH